ncbi:MAG: PilZ domain-containing protein [Ignavibacteriales bacterium]
MAENFISDFSFEDVTISLRDFLKEGNKIRTRFIADTEWTQNTLYAVEIDTFEIAIKVTYLVNNISNDDVLEFKYFYEDYEYLMRGTVEDIDINFGTITIRVYSIKRVKNRRTYPRFDVSLCCYAIPDVRTKHYYAITNNISRGGISFKTKADIEIGQVIGLNIYLSKDRIISMAIKILRKKALSSSFIYDAEIANINRKSEGYFNELLSVLEQYDDEMYFNYINTLNKSE